MADYAARIRAARAYADLTQDELADRLGVEVQTIKRREAGSKEPKKGERIAIAAICGVPLDFLERGFEAQMSEGEIRASAELLGPLLLEAARELGQAEGKAQPTPDARDRLTGAGEGAGE